jgi:hypothetical protein
MKTITVRPFFTAKFLLFAGAALLLLSGCDVGVRGNGHVTTENRPIGDFTTVEAFGAMEIEWSPGGPALAVTVDENLQRELEASVRGHKLVLRTHDNLRPTRHTSRVRITSSALTGAAMHGAVNLSAAKLTGDNFFLDVAGATKTTLAGNVGALTASMSGASRLQAENLQTRTTELSITGAGRADVVATETLRTAISGAGKVSYAGNPKTVEKRITGAGSIHRTDESARSHLSVGQVETP